MLRESAPRRGNVEFVDQLVENLETEDAVVYGGLQKFGDVLRQITVRRIVKPAQFGNATNQFDEGKYQKVLQLRSFVGQISQNVVANVDPLRHGKRIPMRRNELNETVGSHQAGVLRGGIVQNILTLWNVLRIGLQRQQPLLCILARDRTRLQFRGHARVKNLAQGFHLRKLRSVHGSAVCREWGAKDKEKIRQILYSMLGKSCNRCDQGEANEKIQQKAKDANWRRRRDKRPIL